MAKKAEIDEKIDRKLGVLVEHMNDQFERVLEAVESTQESLKEEIQRGNERLEKIEHQNNRSAIDIQSMKHKIDTLKIRSDRQTREQEDTDRSIKSLDKRVARLEKSS